MLRNTMANSKRILIIVVSICLVMATFNHIATNVYAYNDYDYVVEDGMRMPIPKTYIVERVINTAGIIDGKISHFKEPSDIFVSEGGFIYVVDTGNNRIVKMNLEGELVGVFTGPEDKPFKAPEGIFVDETEDIFVADTGNSRIVHLDKNGRFIEEFVAPKSDLIGDNEPFTPSKIVVSPTTGYMYVVRGENIMIIDAYNNFRGFFGQTKIGFSLTEVLLKMFASEEQKKFIKKRLASTYINIDLGPDGMIYATNMDRTEGEIKRLNSVGTNTYRKYKSISNATSYNLWARIKKEITEGNFIAKSFRFGETMRESQQMEGYYEYFLPTFRDICVDKNGIVTVVEESTGKLYQYDRDGNALTVFGDRGEKKGTFIRAVAIDVDNEGRIYVLDKLNNNIQVFAPTEFIKLVHKAVTQYNLGNYQEAYDIWLEVLNINENYVLAHVGIGNALFKQEKWKEAMEEFKLANDRPAYSKAFAEYRYETIREHFFLILIILIAAVVLIGFILTRLVRYGRECNEQLEKGDGSKLGIGKSILLGFHALLHPMETFDTVKYNRERVNPWAGAIIFFAVFVTRVAYIFVVHYPLQDIEISDTNIIFEAMKILLPPLTWVVASFAVTSIMSGESKFADIFITSAYCMIPYIIIHIPLMFLSHALCWNERGWYAAILYFTNVWILILYFLSIKVLNDYSVGRAIATYVISGLGMLLIWFLMLLLYALSVRLMQFIRGIIIEIQLTWF